MMGVSQRWDFCSTLGSAPQARPKVKGLNLSIKIMSAIWDGGPKGSTLRFVLIALADNANDDGECWPSVATIGRKTGLCERAVRTALRQLEADGWLQTANGGGRNGVNRYTVNPAPHAPGTTCPPASNAPKPGTTCPPNPAPHAPKPSYNHKEPSDIGGKPPKAPVRRASSICDDWEPSERNLSDAEAKGMKREDAMREADRFKDYHLAKGSTFKDWDAAWRTWLNNSARFSPRREAPKPPGKRLWDIDPSIFNPDGSIRKTQ